MYYPARVTEPINTDQDVTVTDSDKGFVMTSPNGTQFRQKVDNDGVTETEEVTE